MYCFRYKNAMIKLKSLTVEQIISGPENAVWWTEYVLRYGGARHLRAQAVGVSFFKYYLLDIICILLGVSAILLLISFYILRYVLRRIRLRILQKFDKSGKYKAL